MGQITIKLSGSFGARTKTFSAVRHGHAQAVADAIVHLASDEMSKAVTQDHELAAQGDKPISGFGRLAT